MKNLSELANFINRAMTFGSRPRWGTLFINRTCNRSCCYCAVTKHKFNDIDTKTWYRIIDKIKDMGIWAVNIVGGEPLLRPDIYTILEYLIKNKFIVVLHSNFILMTRQIIDELSRIGLFALTASFDSFNGFEKNDLAIFNLLEYARYKGIIPIVSSVVTSKNVRELPAIAKYAISKGIFYNISLYQNMGGVFSPDNNQLVPSQRDLLETMNKLSIIKEKTGGIRTTSNFINPKNLSFYYDKWHCDINRDDWIIVNNDGNLMRCEEYASDIPVLSIKSLRDSRWLEHKKKTVAHCSGCYHHCYFDAQCLRGIKILKEVRGFYRNIRFIRRTRRRDDYAYTNS